MDPFSALMTKLLELAAEDEVRSWEAGQEAAALVDDQAAAYQLARRAVTDLIKHHWVDVYTYDARGKRLALTDDAAMERLRDETFSPPRHREEGFWFSATSSGEEEDTRRRRSQAE